MAADGEPTGGVAVAEYKVLYKLDEAGQWIAWVRGLRRCRGRGRTLRQARRSLRAALGRFDEEPHRADLVEDVKLPGSARALLARHWAARRRAQRAEAGAEEAAGQAVKALLDLRLNVRDAADLLGVPYPKAQRMLRR
jgi:predicted RNase H-like HicB family nuclease